MAADFLSRIITRKKTEVAAAKERLPENRLRAEAEIKREKRLFYDRLEKPGALGINIIAEIKRASPSKGPICPGLDPAEYARAYEMGGAAAMSVLTDGPGFQGCLEDLIQARKSVALPVLRKDFIISSYQLYESVMAGADAVLLIVRILSQAQLCDYLALCQALLVDALVEVHSAEEIETATRAGARLIGINNRNLRSFKTDVATAENLVRLLESDQVAVAESGIRTREDIRRLMQSGIWNFLIGESLVRSKSPKRLIEHLAGIQIYDGEIE